MTGSETRAAKGHPKGLYPLFFIEMWERLAFYVVIGLLFLYCKDTERGGLAMSVKRSAEVLGTYMAFVYFTPFLGGMIADRYIGYRKAVFAGGICMAIGFFAMWFRSETMLYLGLLLLCLGNGLFKPNISAMVGKLYAPGDPRRDAGFNIFYMGINIGASASAILSAPLRNLFSFNAAFVAAGVGLLVGVTILVVNWKNLAVADVRPTPTPEDVTIGKIVRFILLPASVFGAAGYFVGTSWAAVAGSIGPITFAFLIGMLPIIFYFAMLVRRSSPEEKPGMSALLPVYLCGAAFFMILHLSGGLMTFVAENNTNRRAEWIGHVPGLGSYSQKAMPSYYANAAADLPRPDERTLLEVDARAEAMFGARSLDTLAIAAITRDHPDVRVVARGAPDYQEAWEALTSKVFAAGVVRISEATGAHGRKAISVKTEPETATPVERVALVRDVAGQTVPVIPISAASRAAVYAGASGTRLEPGASLGLVNAEMITALLNPLFVVLLTPLVVAFFTWRARRKKEVSTARKIFWGMVIAAIAIAIMATGVGASGNGAAKMSALWLVVFYAVITLGELCLSPMSLSLVTKLAPKRLVGLMMGGWFLAIAIGNKMSGFISGLAPTVSMFLVLGALILLVAGFIFVLLPRLDRALEAYGA